MARKKRGNYKKKLDIVGVDVRRDYVKVRRRDGTIVKYKLIGKGHYQKVGKPIRPKKMKKK